MISTSARQPRRWHSGLDGSIFEIDLSKKNAAALRKALTEFMEHGRRVKPNAAVKPGLADLLVDPARAPRRSGNGLSGMGSRFPHVAGLPLTSSRSTRQPTPDAESESEDKA
jgi:hypothetical protein